MKLLFIEIRSVFFGLTIVIFSIPALAIPINYNEAVDGDISSRLSDRTGSNFLLDAGLNTISGTVSVGPNFPGDIDFDTFFFTVPDLFTLVSVSFVYDLIGSYGGGTLMGSNYNLWELQGSSRQVLNSTGSFNVLNPTSRDISMFETVLPLTGGSYWVNHSLFRDSATANVAGGSWAYQMTFNVISNVATTVPAPPVLWLFLIGLIALVSVRRMQSI